MDLQGSSGNWLDRLGLDRSDAGASPSSFQQREGLKRFTLVALLALVLLGPIMTFGGVSLTDEGSVERQVGYLIVLGLSLFAALPGATRASLFPVPLPVLLAFAWAWLSLVWAIDPAVSLRRLVLTTTVAISVFILVRHSGYRTVVDTLRWTLFAAILLSYVVVFGDHSVGVHEMYDEAIPTALVGNWRGFLGHKNFAGAVCALTMLLFIFDAKRYRPALRIAVLVVAGYFLFRSQSKTSAGMLVLAGLGGLTFEMFSRRLRSYLVPALTIVGASVWLGTSAYVDLIRANVLDPTSFTGRGQIWSVLLKYAGDHPMFGAGFGSFWNIGQSSPIYSYGQGYVTLITVGHSGYIDQLITVGLPGMLLMAFAVMIWPLWKLLVSSEVTPERGALLASLLMFCIGHNVTESGLFERDAIISTMLFLVTALVAFGLRPERPGKAASRQAGDQLLKVLNERRRQGLASSAE